MEKKFVFVVFYIKYYFVYFFIYIKVDVIKWLRLIYEIGVVNDILEICLYILILIFR